MDIEKIIREYIDKTVHMSLATSSGNKPWICEMHFTYDEDLNIYWRSLESRRHSQEIASNPSVAGNIVRQHDIGEYPHAIYFEGNAELMTDESQFDSVCQLFIQRRIGRGDMIADAMLVGGQKFYKATVDNWYTFGKFDGESSGKYQLTWNGGQR